MTSIENCTISDSCSEDSEDSWEYLTDEQSFSFDSDSDLNTDNINDTINKPNSQSLWFRAQKRLVSRLIRSPKSVKSLIGRSAYKSLKALNELIKLNFKSDKESKTICNLLIKTISKIGVITQQRTLTQQDYENIRNVKSKSRTIGLTIISFALTDYTYDYIYLYDLLFDCKLSIIEAVKPHLSLKSIERINYLFNNLSSADFLNRVFDVNSPNSENKVVLNKLVTNLGLVIKNQK